MASTSVYRTVGQTYKIAVTDSASTSLQIDDTTNDQINYIAVLNTGTKPAAVRFSSVNPCPSAVFPGANPGDFVFPANMTQPVVVATPTTPCYVSAVCASTESTTLYLTACGDQS